MRVFQSTYKNREGQTTNTRTWYVELRDQTERPRKVRAFADKRASEELGRKLERLVSLRVSGERPDMAMTRWVESLPATITKRLAKIGLLDAIRMASVKPIREHIDDYKQSLADSGATPEYVQKTIHRITSMVDETKAVFLTDLAATALTRFLADRRQAKREGDSIRPGLSVKSSNHYLAAAKSFANWLVKERRLSENPYVHLSVMNAKANRRHVRRALEPAELRRLLTATSGGPDRFGMSSEQRFWLYRIAVETGLRSNELRSLTRGSFDLNPADPTVTVEAKSAKNRKSATLPLRPDTAAELAAFLAAKLPTAKAFAMPRPENVVVMLRGDLKSAGIAYRDDAGRVADFHSLRVTFASLLLRAGVDVRTARDLMRHSTIAMTADVYAVTMRGSMNEAVGRLPDFTVQRNEELRATGSDQNVLARSLARRRTRQAIPLRGHALQGPAPVETQPLLATGTYGACQGMAPNGSERSDRLDNAPPRGLEPLSSG